MIKIVKFFLKWKKFFFVYYYTTKVKIQCKSYEGPIFVNYKSSVSENTILHKNINFNGMHIKNGGIVEIGNNFHSGMDCLMITRIHNFDKGKTIPYDDTYLLKNILIQDNVWIGDGVTIIGDVKIEEGAIIQAGSVVVSNIPKCAIAGGHPAKVFKYRNLEHYETLKKARKFH